MKVSTTSTATLAVPYTCRCAFCGATIHGEEKISVEGHAFAGGYVDAAQGKERAHGKGHRHRRRGGGDRFP